MSTPTMHARSGGAPTSRLTAVFVAAGGMTDATAHAWLDATLPDADRVWAQRGADVLAELRCTGHERLVERLVELLGRPAAG